MYKLILALLLYFAFMSNIFRINNFLSEVEALQTSVKDLYGEGPILKEKFKKVMDLPIDVTVETNKFNETFEYKMTKKRILLKQRDMLKSKPTIKILKRRLEARQNKFLNKTTPNKDPLLNSMKPFNLPPQQVLLALQKSEIQKNSIDFTSSSFSVKHLQREKIFKSEIGKIYRPNFKLNYSSSPSANSLMSLSKPLLGYLLPRLQKPD